MIPYVLLYMLLLIHLGEYILFNSLCDEREIKHSLNFEILASLFEHILLQNSTVLIIRISVIIMADVLYK